MLSIIYGSHTWFLWIWPYLLLPSILLLKRSFKCNLVQIYRHLDLSLALLFILPTLRISLSIGSLVRFFTTSYPHAYPPNEWAFALDVWDEQPEGAKDKRAKGPLARSRGLCRASRLLVLYLRISKTCLDVQKFSFRDPDWHSAFPGASQDEIPPNPSLRPHLGHTTPPATTYNVWLLLITPCSIKVGVETGTHIWLWGWGQGLQ